MRGIRAALAVVVVLLAVVAGSYLIHRGPTPTAAEASGPGQGAATTTPTVPRPPAGLDWKPLGPVVAGRRAMEIAFPAGPATAPTEVAVWIDHTLVTPELIPGRTVPGGTGWDPFAEVAAARRPALLAAFNGGINLTDARGGIYVQRRTAAPLVAGAASLVINTHGSTTVGQWGRDANLSPAVVAVRQNLVLLVDHGAATAAAGGPFAAWGPTTTKTALAWRSAAGTDGAGDLIYVAGSSIDPASLAALAVKAGCVQAMEMAINHTYVSFNTYLASSSGAVQGTKALGSMSPLGDRYLTPDDRDFVALYRR